MRESLLPLAALVTPNLDEAAILTGRAVHDEPSMERAGETLLRFGAGAALVKGGHLAGDDDQRSPGDARRHPRLPAPPIATTSTHGTGCTLSAAITAGLALGRDLETAVADALDYVHRAIAAAPALGGGHGPLDHTVAAPALGITLMPPRSARRHAVPRSLPPGAPGPPPPAPPPPSPPHATAARPWSRPPGW